MSETAVATTDLPLDILAATIKARVEAGDKSAEKAADHYRAAGLQLVEAKKRIAENGGKFADFVYECGIGRSRAYELIGIANGTKTVAGIRATVAERVARHADKNRKARESVTNGWEKECAENRAMCAEADKERLQAEVDRLTEENERLINLDDSAVDIAENLIEMDDQKKLAKIAKLINDHLKHPERTPFQRNAVLHPGARREHADGKRFTVAEIDALYSWKVEAVDGQGRRWGNGVRLNTEEEARLYAEAASKDGYAATEIIRAPGEPSLASVSVDDAGDVLVHFMHGMCSSLEWRPA